jgi:hypothetical protein
MANRSRSMLAHAAASPLLFPLSGLVQAGPAPSWAHSPPGLQQWLRRVSEREARGHCGHSGTASTIPPDERESTTHTTHTRCCWLRADLVVVGQCAVGVVASWWLLLQGREVRVRIFSETAHSKESRGRRGKKELPGTGHGNRQQQSSGEVRGQSDDRPVRGASFRATSRTQRCFE